MSCLATREFEALTGPGKRWRRKDSTLAFRVSIGEKLCAPEEIKQVQGESMGSSVRLGDLLKVSIAGLTMLPRFLAPLPMFATPLLSGPDRSPEGAGRITSN